MNNRYTLAGSVLATALAFMAAACSAEPAAPAPVSRAEFDAWMQEISNWGRWGEGDQLGTLNLITPAKSRAAIALVREGVSVSLALDLNTKTPPYAYPPTQAVSA